MINYKLIPGRKIKERLELEKEQKATISIITPFYNGGKTLEETANTVFSQTYPFFEWIIVDDGSKDEESLKKLDEISKKDKRIKVYHKKNGGPSLARDFGISKCTKESKYVFFLDCDDMIENNMLECMYWTLETHPKASFTYTAMTNFGDSEFIWEKYLTIETEKKDNIINISTMVKKEDLLEVGCFGLVEKSVYEDWNLWLKLLAAGKIPIRINAPLFWYRKNNSSEVTRANNNRQRAMEIINKTAETIKKEPEIIQFPRYSEINYLENENITMTLPKYKKGKKKNILFMFPWMTIGGADLFNLELIKRLNKEKYYTITLTSIPFENPLRQEFYETSNESYDMSTFLERKDYIKFVDYLIDSRKIDIVFVSNSAYGYAMLPYIRAKHKNVVIIDYVHSMDYKFSDDGFVRYSKDFDSCIDKTFTCNNYTTNQLKNNFEKENTETIYIGTDAKRFDPSKFNKNELKEKYKIPKDKTIITFIARLNEEKRPELFLDIAKELLKENKNLHFVIAGDGLLYKKVKNKIAKNKITNSVSLLGIINSDKVEEIYAISDITVNCSSLEGLALSSYESLSMKVPVVSSDVGGQKELIDDKVGRIVKFKNNPKEEIKDYVAKIKEVIANIEELKENTRIKIEKSFTLNKMVEKFEEKFEKLKPKGTEIDEELALNIYNTYLDKLSKDYKWFCKEYNSKYDIEYQENSKSNTFKAKLKSKIKNISYKFGIKKEMTIIVEFLRNIIVIIRDIKEIIFHIYCLIKNFLKSILAGIKIILILVKKIIKKIVK
ncbi:MAG: glycosyltransferase [Bacilli bacterium]|nr:glycosyltransferase [Bacilli bacterium]